jgi:Zn-finger nucleic acid-binding protein
MKCLNCGFDDEGNFCSNCGNRLQQDNAEEFQEDFLAGNPAEWTGLCPVCKKASLQYNIKKVFLGFKSRETYDCPKCRAVFLKEDDKYKLISVSDKGDEIWVEYGEKPLSPEEWVRISHGGISDEKQRTVDLEHYYSELSLGNIDPGKSPDCPVILKRNEEHIVTFPGITLKEPRAVRRTTGGYAGPRFRVAKGVSFSLGAFGASSESHDEIRDIDRGLFTITTKRLIFSGNKKTTGIDLSKIISINPYSDGIGVNRENREKMQYFVGIPEVEVDINVDGRLYREKFSGLMLMSIIEGLINRMNNSSVSAESSFGNSESAEERRFKIQAERNLKGRELEKNGDAEGAVLLYEENIAEGFEGNFPYERLAIIYRKKKEYSEEIRVLKRAIFVFENYASKGRSDLIPKTEKFKERLAKAEVLEEKASAKANDRK